MSHSPRIPGATLECERCGSYRGPSLYEDGSAKCHKCHHKWWPNGEAMTTTAPARDRSPLLTDVRYLAVPSRGLSQETCEKWGYGYSAAEDCHVADWPARDGSGVVAQKLRYKGKRFAWRGESAQARDRLYGEWLWRAGGKIVVVTTGELDALSVSQAQGNRYPVASVPDGDGSAERAVAGSLPWLESFERVVLMFDQDESGQKAAQACARLLTPGKAYIARLPRKDASDVLTQDGAEALRSAVWEARPFEPPGIIEGDALLARLERGPEPALFRYPYPELDRRTLGARRGNIVLLVAGIGAGKSTLCREITRSVLEQGLRVGVVPLEETVDQFLWGLLSTIVGENLAVREGEHSGVPPRFREAFESVRERLVFLDDAGDRRGGSVIDAVRFMRLGRACDVVVVDHLTMVVAGAPDRDDRRYAEQVISDLESLVKRTGVTVIVVLHLRKVPDGRSHEEGRAVGMADIRGSGLVPALSHQIIAYERNQQSEGGPRTGTIRVLKARPVGRTGTADVLAYDERTGRLTPLTQPGMAPPPGADLDAVEAGAY